MQIVENNSISIKNYDFVTEARTALNLRRPD